MKRDPVVVEVKGLNVLHTTPTTNKVEVAGVGKPIGVYVNVASIFGYSEPWHIPTTVINTGTGLLMMYYRDPNSFKCAVWPNNVCIEFVSTYQISSNRACFYSLPEDLEKEAMKIHEAQMQYVMDYAAVNTRCVGADPEVFVRDSKTKKVIPAWEFLPSKKIAMGKEQFYKDQYGENKWKNDHIFWDGFQAELAVTKNQCLGYMVDNVQNCLKEILKAAKAHNPNAELTCMDVVQVPESKLVEIDAQYTQFGCEPSLSAYGDEPLMGIDGRTCEIRTAGCHVHMGYEGLKKEEYAAMVREIDRTAGIMITSMLGGLEDPRRRIYYGRAGEYRMPKHGVEYRTPGPGILCDPRIYHLAVDLIRWGAYGYTTGSLGWWNTPPQEEVQRIINECDYRAARKVLKVNMNGLQGFLDFRYAHNASRAATCIMQGVKKIGINVNDMKGNWLLGEDAPEWRNHSDDTRKSFVGGWSETQVLTAEG